MCFTDIEGSTALLRRLGDRYGDALSAQRALLRAAFADCGGQEMGTEGDSFFVVFGSAADAVRCCVAAQRALSGHDWPGGIPVRVRMGLHSGEPVRHEDGYVGLDVHRAARIAAVAHGGQVVLSEATRQLAGSRLPDQASLLDLGLHRLKDIEAPEHIYQLVAAGLPERFPPLKSTLAEATAPTAAWAAPIVGRVPERKALLAAYARVVAGHPQVLLITGAAGLGKTRLVEELCAQAESAAGGARVLLGESAPLAGAALAYGPFVAALRDQAGWLLDDDRTPDMLVARHRLFVRVLELLAGLAIRSPVVLVLEDLHWADDSSRELLAFLAVRLRDQPVMLIGTLREEELASSVGQWLAELERRPRVTRLRLGRLADSEIAELVTGLLPADGASEDRVAAMVDAADGNPLYARELAYAGPQALPASITDAVLAKVTGLTAQARAVVDQVCVADGGMSHELLAAAVPLPEERLLASARRAVASGLLVPAGDGYAFNHALTRQVLYAHLLPGERRHLHHRLAEALAARPNSDPRLLAQHWHLASSPDRAGPTAVLAARQAVAERAYPEAVRSYALAIELAAWLPEAGPALLEEAARAAGWAGDPDRAAGWIADALAQSGDAAPTDRARLLERLGRYQFDARDLNAAVDATEQAVALLPDGPPSALRARVLAALATGRMLLGDFGSALPVAERAVTEAQQAGAVAEHAHGLATLGIVLAHGGEFDAGIAALRTSFSLARRTGNVEDIVRAAADHVYLLYTAGRFTEALDLAKEGRAVAESLDAPPALTSTLDNNIAAALIAIGRWAEAGRLLETIREWNQVQEHKRYDDAIDCYEAALAGLRKEGDRKGEVWTLINIGNALSNLSRWRDAAVNYYDALYISKELGDRRGQAQALANLGAAYTRSQRFDQAIPILQDAVPIFEEIDDRRGRGAALANLGVAHRELGHLDQSIELYLDALTSLKETGDRHTEGMALLNLAASYRQLGRINEAIEVYHTALEVSQSSGDLPNEGEVLAELGDTFYGLRQKDRASLYWLEAAKIAQELGNDTEMARLQKMASRTESPWRRLWRR